MGRMLSRGLGLIKLDMDICIGKRFLLSSGTEISRSRDTLLIRSYKCVGRISGKQTVDTIWGALVKLKDDSARMRFGEWLAVYHSDIVLFSRNFGQEEISYEEFLSQLTKNVLIFVP